MISTMTGATLPEHVATRLARLLMLNKCQGEPWAGSADGSSATGCSTSSGLESLPDLVGVSSLSDHYYGFPNTMSREVRSSVVSSSQLDGMLPRAQ